LGLVAQESGVEEAEAAEKMESEVPSAEEHLLEEIELKEAFQFLEKELELKVYNERSGFVMRPKTPSG
jgi:hypothetical protein